MLLPNKKLENFKLINFRSRMHLQSRLRHFSPNCGKWSKCRQCCYKLKEVYLSFIYEVIIGFGFGYLYLEKYNYFFIKFIFQTFIFCILCFSGYCINFDYHGKNKDRHVKNVIYRTCNVWNFILVAIFIVWKIVDFFIFGLNLVKDTNGMRLYNEWWNKIVINLFFVIKFP